jgi:hypothetical protein
MHLAGKADAGDGIAGKISGLKRFADGDAGGPPPVARILFGPAGFGTGEVGVLCGAGSENCAAVIKDDGASSTGTNVNA